MLFNLIFALAVSVSASAKPKCFTLMTRPRVAPQTTNSELASGRLWLESLGAPNGIPEMFHSNAEFQNFVYDSGETWDELSLDAKQDWAARFAVQRWNEWKMITPRQRELALSLELNRLGAGDFGTSVIDSKSVARLRSLSRQNLNRWLGQMREKFPVDESAVPESVSNEALRMSEEFSLRFTQSRDRALPRNIQTYEPVASARELIRLGLRPHWREGFYSEIIGGSATVGFDLVAIRNQSSTVYSFERADSRPAFQLQDDFSTESSFLIPHFYDPAQLNDFFNFWEGQVPSVPRLGLQRYILTKEDGQTFLQVAFAHWLRHLNQMDTRQLERIRQLWNNLGGAQRVINQNFFHFMNLREGLSLRIPVAVSPKDFILLHFERIYADPMEGPSAWSRTSPPYDSRRVDRSSKP